MQGLSRACRPSSLPAIQTYYAESHKHRGVSYIRTAAIRSADHPSAPVILKISEVERLEGALTKQHLLYAITALAEDGMVVLDGAIDLAHIDAMNTRIVSDCKDLVQRPNAHFKYAHFLLV